MLTITVPGEEQWNETDETFTTVGDVTLHLEHSLVSLSKWEQKFEKPFLSKNEKTDEEALAYIEAMITDPVFPPGVLAQLTEQNIADINNYVNAKMSAAWFNDEESKSRQVITNELIYYWMTALNIPFQPCETWHLNRLFRFIKVCSHMSSPPKKMNRHEQLARQRELNEQRRAQLGTRG